MEIKISIIIPCYNVAPYILRTFEALEAQTYKNFEVIVINDGSTDDSLNIIEHWATTHPSYSIFSYENAGVSEARNRGLPYATGDYIYFLDADDYFLPTLMEEMVTLAAKNGMPDIVRCGYKWTYCKVEEIKLDNNPSQVFIYEGDEIVENMVKPAIGFSEMDVYEYYKTKTWKWKGDGLPVWCHFYKKQTILKNNIKFVRGLKMVEDRIFNVTFLAYAKKAVITTKILYFYMQNNGLLSQIYKNHEELLKDKISALKQREKIRELYKKEKGIDLFSAYRGSCVLACIQLAVTFGDLPFFKGYSLYKQYVGQHVVVKSLKGFMTHGAPIKLKIPLMLLKYKLHLILYLLIFLAKKCKLKINM